MAGNANSGPRKAKVWRDALMLILNRPADEAIPTGKTNLDKVVTKQVQLALEGDSQSIRDIADRLDGKPAQAIVGGDEDDNPINLIARIERVIIDPSNSNSPSIPATPGAEPV